MENITRYKFLILLTLALSINFAYAADNQSILGKWQTIDDETGEAKSVVEIFERNGKVFGKVIKLFPKPGNPTDPICSKCPGDKKDQKIIGMEIIEGLSKDGSEYSGGTILDPKSGTSYRCKIWRDNENLAVRGYISFFYRTQTWLPYKQHSQ